MPLDKRRTKRALFKDASIEMKHGKPRKQAFAIAYSVTGLDKKHKRKTKRRK